MAEYEEGFLPPGAGAVAWFDQLHAEASEVLRTSKGFFLASVVPGQDKIKLVVAIPDPGDGTEMIPILVTIRKAIDGALYAYHQGRFK